MRTICFEKKIPKFLLTRALRPLWPGVVFSPLSPTRVLDLPDGPLPGPRWVRVRNRLGGICASDLHLLYLKADPRVAPAALPGTDRMYMGHELVGEVVEVGAQVTSLQPGERVILDAESPNCLNQEIIPPCRHCREGNLALCENASLGQGSQTLGGGWGEGLVVHESALYKVPDGLGDEAAVLVEPLSVGLRAALRTLPRPGERALVVGCGTIGLGVIQALRALASQSQVVAMARYPQQAEMARKLGAEALIRHDDPYQAAARLTDARLYAGPFDNRMLLGGFDVIYDIVGTGRTVQDCLRWSR